MCIFKNNLFKLKKDVHTRMFMFEYIYHKLKELPFYRGNEVDEQIKLYYPLSKKSNIIRSLSIILIFASTSLPLRVYIRPQALTTVLKKKKRCIIQVEKRQNT